MDSAAAKPIIDGVAEKASKIPGRDEQDHAKQEAMANGNEDKIYVNITNSGDEWKRIDIAAKAAKQSRQSQRDRIPWPEYKM